MRVLFEEVAPDYDRSGTEFFAPVGERLVSLTDVGPGDAVLDVGSGRGAALFPAARAAGLRGSVTGIDLSESMVASLRQDARDSGLGRIDAAVMDAQAPRFPPESFDVLTGSMSVHLFPDVAAAFRSYFRLLRPGGRLGLSAPVSVDHPRPEVFGLRSIARMVSAYGSGSGAYPYSEAFGGAEQARSDLLAAGFTSVNVVEEPAFISSGSTDQLLRWTRTHGMRLLWEQVPAAEHRRVQQEIATEARSRSEHPDRVVLRVPVMYIIARRPGTRPLRLDRHDGDGRAP
ncbi:class I SAM-dependent methyltransferase [Nocardiopsis sediminis]|uniref:Class I SAM-dependent methyltransferase n=1 Tax=Nocardiopsis sediminis TaxID=1778267 RepID=A0ABV8FKR4_9ACTN